MLHKGYVLQRPTRASRAQKNLTIRNVEVILLYIAIILTGDRKHYMLESYVKLYTLTGLILFVKTLFVHCNKA